MVDQQPDRKYGTRECCVGRTGGLNGAGAAAEELLEEIDGKAGAEDDPEKADVMGGGEDGKGRGATPHERFAGEPIEPVGLCSTGGKARTQRGDEARHGGKIASVAFSLSLEQSSFLAKNEAIDKEEHAKEQDEEAEAAGEQADAEHEKEISKIKRVADIAKRPVGDQLFPVQRGIEYDGTVQVGDSPGAKERAQSDAERSEGEEDRDAMAEGGRVAVRTAENELAESHGEIRVVHAVKRETQPEDSRDEPEAEAEFEFRGSKIHRRPQ